MHEVVHGDSSRYRIVGAREPLLPGATAGEQVLLARVAGKGLSDEIKGAFYAVLEAPDGFAYHVPLDAKTAEAVRPGDVVFFGTRPELGLRPIDRRIVAIARETGGVCALEAIPDEAERARAARRLRELERGGLVSARGPNRWSVPDDLTDRLENQSKTVVSRERVWVQRVPVPFDQASGHRGPVWLDRVEEAPLAYWGFGADVRRALDRRRETLRALGIALEDPRKDAKLRDVERRAVGEEMAARLRQEFLAKPPERFRGRLQAGHEGTPYAIVTDGARFVLVPASSEVRALAGKAVTVVRDVQGRIAVRAIDRDRDR
jgi:hypothetical protein